MSTKSQTVDARQYLRGKDDLSSLEEFVELHANAFKKKRSLKGHFTSDLETLEIAKRVIREGNRSDNAVFLEHNILSKPDYSKKEVGSILVQIGDIEDYPACAKIYEGKKGKDVLLGVGGPAAEDQSVLASMIPDIKQRLEKILYVTKDYKESNVSNSARQSHARHANALNGDHTLTGHVLLPKLLLRKICGVKMSDVLRSDYTKIDLRFTLNPKKIKIYFCNELNWLKQELKERNGQLTEHDLNRMEAVLSQEIMRIIDKKEKLDIVGGVEGDSSAIHVAFTQADWDAIKHDNKMANKVGIASSKLSDEEIAFFFQENQEVRGAFKYEGDTHLAFDIHEKNRQFSIHNGVQWLENMQVEKILLSNGESGADLAGVLLKNGEYHYANKLHFTGGYKVRYSFEKSSVSRFSTGSVLRNIVNKMEDYFGLQDPVNNNITTATGVSVNAVCKRSARMDRIIEKYGSTGELAITNSHWTTIARDDTHLILRMTAGGNTGSEEYQPSYFLNVMSNTRRIFGDDLVGIISSYGCSRSVNAKNSTEFARITDGFVASYGKGGTGNTKRHAEAATGLMMIGFHQEIIDYFKAFTNAKGENTGDKLETINDNFQHTQLVHDHVRRVNRRMGYDTSLSCKEKMVMALCVIAAFYMLVACMTILAN